MKHTSRLRGKNAELYYVKAGGTYSNHWTLKQLSSRSKNFPLMGLDFSQVTDGQTRGLIELYSL
jgi:hypothetical protein